MIPSPTPEHNFDEVPTVTHLDEFWHRKYGEDDDGQVRRIATGDEVAQPGDGTGVHLPSPSYWPLVVTRGVPDHRLRPALHAVAVVIGLI
jgi:cytochrome c oxidase subunit I